MTKTWCVGGTHYRYNSIKTQYEKRNPKTKILVKIIKGNCSICGRNKSQIFTKQMTRAERFMEKGKCKKFHCSSPSNTAWCDLNNKGDILKLHDKCPNLKCNCQKIITFTPHQNILEAGSIECKLQKSFRGTQIAWNNFFKTSI